MARRRVARVRRPKRVVRRRGRNPFRKSGRGRSGLPDIAMLSERRTMINGIDPSGNFVANTMYNFVDFRLVDFPRAVQVAQAYQFFKMKKITITIKFLYDTFTAGGGSSRPNLYYMIDKAGSLPTNSTLELLKSTGARPKVIDNRSFSITWTPSVLDTMTNGVAGGGVGSGYKIAPWLNTVQQPVQPGVFIPSGTEHLGIYWFVEQVLGASKYQLDCEVQFAFKKPLWKIIPGAPEAIGAEIAKENNSADGIIGGVDGV